MKFYAEISEDERADWRKHEATKLALAMLRQRSEEHKSDAIACLVGGDKDNATIHASKAKGFDEAIDLMEHDK